MTPKQDRFAREYMVDHNATQAAIRAGYAEKTARVKGSQLLGTGTVAGVAKTLGRYGISNDLSESYNRLAVWRITQSGHFTKSEQRAWADRQGTML